MYCMCYAACDEEHWKMAVLIAVIYLVLFRQKGNIWHNLDFLLLQV